MYNFWEPLHYLDRGYGFQTWETSPAYAIRSWAYISLHLPLVTLVKWMGLDKVRSILQYEHDEPQSEIESFLFRITDNVRRYILYLRGEALSDSHGESQLPCWTLPVLHVDV